jgi:hypothetical protein
MNLAARVSQLARSPMSADKSAPPKGRAAPKAGRSRRGWRRAVLIGVPSLVVAPAAILFVRHQSASRLPPPALARADGPADDPGSGAGDGRDQTATFLVGATADITARPTSLTGPVSAAAYWVNDADVQRWDAQVDQSGDGIVHVRGTINAPWGGVEDDLAIVITPPGVTPPPPAQCKSPCEVITRRIRYIRAIVPMIPPPDATAR